VKSKTISLLSIAISIIAIANAMLQFQSMKRAEKNLCYSYFNSFGKNHGEPDCNEYFDQWEKDNK